MSQRVATCRVATCVSCNERCAVCAGNNACVDCRDVVNGGARVDKCNVCGGADACVDCAGRC